MPYLRCTECNKKFIDQRGVCLSCSGIRKRSIVAELFKMLGILTAPSYWIFRTWIYGGHLPLSPKTEMILMFGIFPLLGTVIILIAGKLIININDDYAKIKSSSEKDIA